MTAQRGMRQVSLERYFSGVKPPIQPDSPISRLPPELLSDIFLYLPILSRQTQYQDLPPPDPDDFPSAPPPLPWNYIDITRVSKYWRSLALACKPFWSRIPLLNTHWTTVAPDLASPIPLYIHVDLNLIERTLASFEASLLHLPRVRELVFTTEHDDHYLFPYQSMKKIYRLLVHRTASLLEEFVLNAGNGTTIPDDLFSENGLPSLRRLELQYCVIHHTSSLFATTLTSLVLVSAIGAWENTEELVHTLSTMPFLEHLRMERRGTFPEDVSLASTKKTDKLRLNHLKSLTLQADLIQLAAFLELVRFPLDAYISLDAECPKLTSANAYARFPEALGSHFASLSSASSYTSLSVQCTSSIACLTCTHPNATGTLPDHIYVDIAWCDGVAIEHVEALLGQVVGALPVKQAHILEGTRERRVERNRAPFRGWWQGSVLLPNISILTLSEGAASDFFMHLDAVRASSSTSNDGSVRWPFPELYILSLVSANLTAAAGPSGSTTTLYNVLMRELARRVLMRERGTFGLAISRCVVTLAMIRGLTRVLGKDRVVWDKKFGNGSEEGVQSKLRDFKAFRLDARR